MELPIFVFRLIRKQRVAFACARTRVKREGKPERMMKRGDVEREIVFSREQSKADDVPVMMIRASNYAL